MKDYIEERTLDVARYIIANKSTVRDTAVIFGCSKSTIHKDLTDRLPKLNKELYENVKMLLEFNKSERHIRGGKATKVKYENLKKEIS